MGRPRKDSKAEIEKRKRWALLCQFIHRNAEEALGEKLSAAEMEDRLLKSGKSEGRLWRYYLNGARLAQNGSGAEEIVQKADKLGWLPLHKLSPREVDDILYVLREISSLRSISSFLSEQEKKKDALKEWLKDGESVGHIIRLALKAQEELEKDASKPRSTFSCVGNFVGNC